MQVIIFFVDPRRVEANLSCEIQMTFTSEHRTFIMNSDLRTVRFIGGVYRYNVLVCVDEFLLAYPQFQQIFRPNIVRRLHQSSLVGVALVQYQHIITVTKLGLKLLWSKRKQTPHTLKSFVADVYTSAHESKNSIER
ncbi:hypothetical protein C0J52_09797 [Blattella germanica]|nr:hypothetical protein C0J52_09797 [Blattella germanica]